MSDQIDDGGPAFPESGLSGLPNGDFYHGRSGMSLRDYFAAQVIGSIVTRSHGDSETDAAEAYHIADAMLAARKVTR